jgi:sRNA-binding carbon storage regulator CsrA
MLSLARKKHESVVVGRPNGFERMLKVTVLEISGENVLLGFETNNDFPVQSWEMWERIRAPQTSAIQGDMTTNRRF